MTETERDIIARCRQGDKEAFRWVVQTYQRMVFSLALKMMCDEEEAKDIVQDTFIRVWLNIEAYDTTKALTTWIYTITSHLCLDRLKRMKRIMHLADDDKVLQCFAADTDHQHSLENKEWVALVRTLADHLSTKQRWVFTLSQLEGVPASEIEEITGMDAGQVKSNLYVARKKICNRLRKLGYESSR